jgi:uncharacterized protein
MRVFFDTNVLASALTSRGLCAELFERVVLSHELILGEPVIAELLRVLATKLKVPPAQLKQVRANLDDFESAPASGRSLSVRVHDRDDIPILACAIAARVDSFVTGDKALLQLGEVEGLPILSPRQLWQKLAGLNEQERPK